MTKTNKQLSPRIILIGGRSGTGKTTLSQGLKTALSEKEKCMVLDSDVVRKELMGVDMLTRLPESAYTVESYFKLQDEMQRRMESAIKQGQSVIVTATFLMAEARHEIEKKIESYAVPAGGVFLAADRATLEKRIENRKNDASDMTVNILAKQFNNQKIVLSDLWQVLDSHQRPEQVLHAALDIINRKIQPKPRHPVASSPPRAGL